MNSPYNGYEDVQQPDAKRPRLDVSQHGSSGFWPVSSATSMPNSQSNLLRPWLKTGPINQTAPNLGPVNSTVTYQVGYSNNPHHIAASAQPSAVTIVSGPNSATHNATIPYRQEYVHAINSQTAMSTYPTLGNLTTHHEQTVLSYQCHPVCQPSWTPNVFPHQAAAPSPFVIEVEQRLAPRPSNISSPHLQGEMQTYRGDSLSSGSCTYISLTPERQSCQAVGQATDVERIEDDGMQDLAPESPTVCFGMLIGISGRCDCLDDFPGITATPVAFSSSSLPNFSACGLPEFNGRVVDENERIQMLKIILDVPAVTLGVTCKIDPSPPTRKELKGKRMLDCELEITIYGPSDLFDEIGSFVQEYDMYLQDPTECHQDVKYYNPHKFSSVELESSISTSEVVSRRLGASNLQAISQKPDLLDVLSSHSDLEENPQPLAILTPLEKHQKQALTFMLQRERGWTFTGDQPDVWESITIGKKELFINRISGAQETEEPPDFRGGIIADPMGLGKTLTMIALAATDIETKHPAGKHDSDGTNSDEPHATLIVVPPPLLDSWEEQLESHVAEGGLRWRRHHGKTRLVNQRDVAECNIVLTTFYTASWEGRDQQEREKSLLFSTMWKRIVLDEAHVIRNRNSRMARSICELDSLSRWAVTGTPIQNSLADFATLLKFIRVHPYTEPKHFEHDISNYLKDDENEEAVQRLKRLSACILLRRPESTIRLPPRRDTQFMVELSKAERLAYNEIREQAIAKIDEALRQDTDASRSSGYVNALQRIESLRLFCNLGLHYYARHHGKGFDAPDSALDTWSTTAQQTFNSQREMGPMTCMQCSAVFDIAESLLDDSSTRQKSQLSQCLKFICSDCTQKLRRTSRPAICGHNPSCPFAEVCTDTLEIEELPGGTGPDQYPQQLPSKVKALVGQLKALPPGVKSIVFSTWRMTLDVVEAGLKEASIACLRFDGKVPQKQRQSKVDSFRHDTSIRVMLLTLSCGAVGLTLTVASRAYLIEPHWNPTLEEQALARIHRIGQKNEVTTVRFYVRDSFEVQVIKAQERKKRLASLLLTPHEGVRSEDSLSRLLELRDMI